MKLRITHNSLRIRIQRTQLAQLQSEGKIVETVDFPMKSSFQYALLVHEGPSVEAQFEDNQLTIKLPESEANTWFNTNLVGITADLTTTGEARLHVLIEKDFPCADRPNEDKSETFWELTGKSGPDC